MTAAEQTQEAGPQEARLDGGKASARLGSLDISRGWAILAVIFIHVTGHFLTALHPVKSHTPPSAVWYTFAILNQDSQWAVPCFLLLSAFVNALSLGRGNDLQRYARRRVQSALLPYLVWSAVYIVVDTLMAHRHFPSPLHIVKLLLTGTAHFHLYFFVLVIEMYMLLPLLMPLFRKRPPFWAIALGAIALQSVIYVLNRYVLLHRFQTTITWDTLPLILGLWLWSQGTRWNEVLRRGVWASAGVTLIAGAIYTPLAIKTMLPNAHLNTAVYQFGEWGFTAGMAFFVVAVCSLLKSSPLTKMLGYFGAESLAIYVMHPLAIGFLDHFGGRKLGTGMGMLLYYAACLALPLAAVWVWNRGKAALGQKPLAA